jgi:heat shock protein HtpX
MNAFVMFLARAIAFAMRSSDSRNSGGSYLVVFALEIVLGILGSMVTAWFSRQREFRADAGGASLAGRESMLAALRRLSSTRELIDPSHQALATMKISGAPKNYMALFSTHPPLEQRIAALESAR